MKLRRFKQNLRKKIFKMAEKIELEIKYMVDDYVRSMDFMQRRFFIFKYFPYLIVIVAVGFALFHLFSAPTFEYGLTILLTSAVTIPILLMLAVGLWSMFLPNPLLKWNIARQMKSSPALQQNNTFSFDENGVRWAGHLGSGEIKWDAVVESVETKNDFFFFTSNRFAHFVPKRAFTNQEQINALRDLAKRNLGDKAKF
jgi:hypothetical protein